MRVLLIGALNLFQLPKGGEEYKNQLIYSKLSEKYNTKAIDTFHWRSNPFIFTSLINQLFFRDWDVILISASSQSVYRLVLILQHFPSISKKTIYFVVGGYFPSAILNGSIKLKPYLSLKSLVVEGLSMKRTLEYAGYTGTIHVLPNFKQFPKRLALLKKDERIFKFLFLSRIHPDKGIQEIFRANALLKNWGFKNFSITFYGPIEEDYRKYFESCLVENTL